MTTHLIPSPPVVSVGKHSILEREPLGPGGPTVAAETAPSERYPVALAVIAAVAGLAATATAVVGFVVLTH